MAVTIKDVAKAAGVSPATVCRALSNPDMVSQQLREKVLQIAAELDYQPNRAARSMITGRTGNLGIILPDIANPFFPGVVKGVQTRARQAGYAVFLADSDEDPTGEADLVRAMSPQIDGLLLCSPRLDEATLREKLGETPVVLLNRQIGELPSVIPDNQHGTVQVVRHLTALGHRRIGYLAGPSTSWTNQQRWRGLQLASLAAGVQIQHIANVVPHFVGGLQAARQVLNSGVTAVVAYNDLVGVGLLRGLRDLGVAPPQRLSVVGWDGIDFGEMSTPALTSVSLPVEQLGRLGVELLLDLVAGREPSAGLEQRLPVQLLCRQSTGPATG